MKNLRIVIADNQFLVREGLTSLIKRSPSFSLVKSIETPEELFHTLETDNQLLVVLNYQTMDFEDERSIIQRLVQFFPSTQFLLLVDEISQNELMSLQNMGFKNFVTTNSNENEILYAIEVTAGGKKYYSDSLLDLLISKSAKRQLTNVNSGLTQSELEVVKLIAEGYTTKEIAFKRHLSYHTVMTHRKNIFRKLQVTNVSELMIYAIKSGWIDNIEYYI
jgi:DNA-binding NarL/FixJ family response regulator